MDYDLQKASLWKRIAAWLFDNILSCVLVVGIALLLSLLLDYDSYSDRVSTTYERYETEFGISFDVGLEEYQGWTEEQRRQYDSAYEKLVSDQDAMYAYNMVVNLTMVIANLSVLAALLVLEFAVPLIFKNGQTIGKKIFSLCVVRGDCVRINTMQLFVRTILGKFTVETMIPIYILLMLFWGITGLTGTIILCILMIVEGILLIATRRNQPIHDILAGTAVADYSSQMIFDSTQELIEYQKKLHAEHAARQEY